MKKLLTAVAIGGAATLTLTTPAFASHEGSVYEGELTELNDSGASGSATIEVSEDGESLKVDLSASGFDLNGPHAMHIHGIVEGDEVSASTCPTMADDADGDGVLTVVEGVPKYGSVQLSLTTSGDTSPDSALAVDRFPAGSAVNYSRTEIPIPDALKPNIGKLHVVVHGIDENDNGMLDLDQVERSSLDDTLPREATAPALCGTLAVQATGAIQTGGGGLAEDGSSPIIPGALAALGAVGLGATVVRRQTRTA